MKMRHKIIIVSVLALGVSACGTSGFDDIKARIGKQAQNAPPKPKTVKLSVPAPTPAADQPGDIPPAIATATPTATELPPPTYVTAPVAKIVRVPADEIIAGKGETLFAVSRRTGAAVKDLAKANNLTEPYALSAGQKIIVPEMRYYIVQPGETASKIARERGVQLVQLASMNDLGDTYTVKQGQKLRLPLDAILPPTREEKAAVAAQQTQPASGNPAPAAQTQVAAPEKVAPQPVVVAEMPTFDWPIDGKILSDFGAKPNGQFNDGINIAARAGQPVRAAADGEIVYASNQLRGFGNLLLIRHKGGWLTAYAHNEALLVKKGTKVRRGEVVARAGGTGSVRSAQLHFEVRQNRKPVNPLRVLPDKNVEVALNPAQ